MYKFSLSKPIDGISEITFTRLTWAAYKQIFARVDIKGSRGERIKASFRAILDLGTPVLTDEQIEQMSLSDYNVLSHLFTSMKNYEGDYKGGLFKLSHNIGVMQDGKSIGEITGLDISDPKMSDLWEYLGEPNPNAKTEIFLKAFTRHVGTSKDVKSLTPSEIPYSMMSASDVLYIQEHIEGKSQGSSAGWTKL